MDPELVAAIRWEMGTAEKNHGQLTNDSFRAFTILAEEVGEVSRELLGERRAINAVAAEHHRRRAVEELVQVMSVCAHMIRNLGGVSR